MCEACRVTAGVKTLVFAAGLVCALGACSVGGGGATSAVDDEAAPTESGGLDARVEAVPAVTLPEPAAPLANAGLEVWEWVTPASGDGLAATLTELGSFDAPEGLDAEIWRASGVRVYAVPAEDASALAARLPATRGRSQRWFGRAPAWAELLRGPALDAGQALIVNGEPVFLSGGSPRLLARAWVEPAARDGRVVGELRTQLLAQVTQPGPREPWRLGTPGIETVLDRALEEGRSFGELRADLRLDGSTAVVLIGLAPGVSFDAGELPAAAEPTTVIADDDEIRTIGERMLVTPALYEWTGERDELRSVRPALHRVVVLVPRAGGGFAVSPRGGGVGGRLP